VVLDKYLPGAGTALGKIIRTAGIKAVANVASQAVGVATGIQEKFDWKDVARATLTPSSVGDGDKVHTVVDALKEMGNAAALSGIRQGTFIALGLQDKFNWAAVAAAGVGSGVSRLVGAVGGGAMAQGGARLIAEAATESLVDGTDFGDNLVAKLPSVIGNWLGERIGNGIIDRVDGYLDERRAARAEATQGPQASVANVVTAEAPKSQVTALTITPINATINVDYSKAGLDPVTAGLPSSDPTDYENYYDAMSAFSIPQSTVPLENTPYQLIGGGSIFRNPLAPPRSNSGEPGNGTPLLAGRRPSPNLNPLGGRGLYPNEVNWNALSNQDYYNALSQIVRFNRSADRIDGLKSAIRGLEPSYVFGPVLNAPGSSNGYERHLSEQLWVVRNRSTNERPMVLQYGRLNRPNSRLFIQSHHINQDAAYGRVIPHSAGLAVAMPGNTPTAPHNIYHREMNRFWAPYQSGGASFGQSPTNQDFLNASGRAFVTAGFTRTQAGYITARAAQQQREYGLLPSASVPRVPGTTPR
jgi:hypothetical protein